jgi:hypothetical protein
MPPIAAARVTLAAIVEAAETAVVVEAVIDLV